MRGENVEYKVGNAEDLDSAGVGVGDNGVDLVVAGMPTFLTIPSFLSPPPLSSCLFCKLMKMGMYLGQAAHWFDHSKVWPQLTRHVRPGGTVVYLVRLASSSGRKLTF